MVRVLPDTLPPLELPPPPQALRPTAAATTMRAVAVGDARKIFPLLLKGPSRGRDPTRPEPAPEIYPLGGRKVAAASLRSSDPGGREACTAVRERVRARPAVAAEAPRRDVAAAQ